MNHNEMTKEQEKDFIISESIKRKLEFDEELTTDELEHLKNGWCANDYGLKCFVELNQCGEDADCNCCWDYANEHRFDEDSNGDEEHVIIGLRKTIIEFRTLANCEKDEKFEIALEEINSKMNLIEIMKSWKEQALSTYNMKLCDILTNNCKK